MWICECLDKDCLPRMVKGGKDAIASPKYYFSASSAKMVQSEVVRSVWQDARGSKDAPGRPLTTKRPYSTQLARKIFITF